MGKGGYIMKTQSSLLLAILVLVPKLAAAQAYPPESGDIKLVASFEFVVGKRVLNPGNYVIHKEKSSGELQICEDGIICETVATNAVQAAEISAQPKVVFNGSGDKHFLSQIWFPDGTGLQLHTSPLESEAANTGTKFEAVYVNADLLCIHVNKGLPPSWH
jgi:hypothetical protein